MAKPWHSKVQFPTDSDFIIRITDATFGDSKTSGNPMLTLPWEVIAPREKQVGAEVYEMAGVASNAMNHLYYPTMVVGKPDDSKEVVKRLTGTGDPTGLIRMMFPDKPEYADNFNPENPDQEMVKAMKGLCLLVQMSPDIIEQRKNPTIEQIEAAKAKKEYPEGDVMKHPVTGKPLIQYRPKVREVFGLAPAGAGANVPY